MYNFLVGGYLPGTNIQLSFQLYVGLMTLIIGVIAIYQIERGQRPTTHAPLHASQLHLRAI